MPFTKLDCDIIKSSVWAEDSDTLRVWIYLLSSSNAIGEVRVTVPALAMQCGLPAEQAQEILDKFCSPDPNSRSQDFEGRRIRIEREPEFKIVILNYPRYREKDYTNAERQKRFREKHKRGRASVTALRNGGVTPGNTSQKSEVRGQKTEVRGKTGGADAPKHTRARFVPPTLQELKAHIQDNGFHFTAEQFMAKYQSIGWVVGKNRTPMKDWRGTCATWEENWRAERPQSQPTQRVARCVNDDRPPVEGEMYCATCLEGIIARRKSMGISDEEVGVPS